MAGQRRRRRAPATSRTGRRQPPRPWYERLKRASGWTWTLVFAPIVTILVGAAASGWLVPLVEPSPATRASARILGVRQDSHGRLSGLLPATDRRDPKFVPLLRCDVAVYAVRLQASGFTAAHPPRLRWTLIDDHTQLAWRVPAAFAVLREYSMNPAGGSRMLWIPAPNRSADWAVRVDVYGAQRGPDDPFDTRRGDKLIHAETLPPAANPCPG